MSRNRVVSAAVAVCMLVGSSAFAHCEVPCGIYDAAARCEAIAEHVTTIEKASKQIAALSKEKDRNDNQIVRWVANKEKHATEIQQIVSQYFLTQRIKPVAESDAAAYGKYVQKLRLLHEMLISAMKAKQSTDLTHVAKLRELLAGFRTAYFAAEAK